MPERIQRQRTKGWRMPAGAVYVGRPTKWGNPFAVSADYDATDAVGAYHNWLLETPEGREIARVAKLELRGKNLACWCSLRYATPCHANVLLEIANA